ncbi:MAG: choice-of-anchor D domain-containing protein [Candidatus Sulfotelmatobacter sp.]
MKLRLLTPLITATLFLLVSLQTFVAHAQAPAGPHRPKGVPADYVITPSGYFHPSCVRRLGQGEILLAEGHVLQHADGTIENIPPCEYPHYTARGEMVSSELKPPTISHSWIEDGNVTTSTSYGEITATVTVPRAPYSNDGQTLYFFPGLEDINDVVSIIQPVLGWNADFASAWGIASWNCCVSGTTWESTPVSVNSGNSILGTVRSTCSPGTLSCVTWNITTDDVTLGKSTTLSDSPSEGQTFNWAFGGALEVYNVVQCTDYPPNLSTNFYAIALYDYNFNQVSNPAWSIANYTSGLTPQCSYGGQVAATQVTLDYGSASPTATLSPSSLNFGDVPTNGPPRVESVTLTNNNTATLTISEMTFTGDNGFSISHNYCGSSVPGLSECTINLELDTSSGGCGSYTGTFYVYDSATNSPQSVALKGVGVNHVAGGC